MTSGDMFRLIYMTYKSQILFITLLFYADAFFRLVFSVLLYNLLAAVMTNQITQAYLLAFSLTIFWYLSRLLRQSGFT